MVPHKKLTTSDIKLWQTCMYANVYIVQTMQCVIDTVNKFMGLKIK